MNPLQAEYFRQKLLRRRAEIQAELATARTATPDDSDRHGDQTDQASAGEDRAFDLINRQREQAMLQQIEQALTRLESGTYGYCEDTGEPIDLHRLEAQPTATLTTAAQAARERVAR